MIKPFLASSRLVQKPEQFESQLETSALSGLSLAERLTLQTCYVALIGSVINCLRKCYQLRLSYQGNKELNPYFVKQILNVLPH